MQQRRIILILLVCSVLATGCSDYVGIENTEEIENLEVTENIEELENAEETGQQTSENPVAEDEISEITDSAGKYQTVSGAEKKTLRVVGNAGCIRLLCLWNGQLSTGAVNTFDFCRDGNFGSVFKKT